MLLPAWACSCRSLERSVFYLSFLPEEATGRAVKTFIFKSNFFMANTEKFIQAVKGGYTFKGEFIKIGRAVLDGEVTEADVNLPLKTMNRH